MPVSSPLLISSRTMSMKLSEAFSGKSARALATVAGIQRHRAAVAPMKKLILKCGLSPGDIVMLTAAIRDLHLCYPGRFQTDVRTVCAGLWDNNPYITPLEEADDVEQIDCSYPLINRANK